MTIKKDETEVLGALDYLTDQTDEGDWGLFGNQVEEDIARGELSPGFRVKFREMIDRKRNERKRDNE